MKRWIGTLVIATAAFASSPMATAMATQARPAGHADLRSPFVVADGQVVIAHMKFTPKILRVPLGTTVVWVNQANGFHTSTGNKGAWDSGPIAPGTTFSVTFDTPGTFAYHCKFAHKMVGQIKVKAP
jgi:plastocyanin